MKQNRRTVKLLVKILVPAVLLLIAFFSGVVLRWKVIAIFDDYFSGRPYIMESALYFHYAEKFAKGEKIPDIDKRAQYPEGLEVKKKLTLGKGLVAGTLYRILGLKNIPFQDFVSHFDALFFCLGIFPLFFIVRGFTKNNYAGIISALLYAIAFPALVRSTGLGFLRENFALPLLFFHLWLFLKGCDEDNSWISFGSGFFLAAGIMTWDFSQFYLLLVALYVAIRFLSSRKYIKILHHFSFSMILTIFAAAINPYLRYHNFLFSYGMMLSYALIISSIICSLKKVKKIGALKIAFVLIFGVLLVLSLRASHYSQTYSHVLGKFFAKIKHLNVKPSDPAELSFSERIEWVPPFHSATTKLGGKYPISDFYSFFILSFLPLLYLIFRIFKRKASETEKMLLYYVATFFLLYLMFARLQVFLIFFLIILIGISFRYLRDLWKKVWHRNVAIGFWFLIVASFMIFEMSHFFGEDKILTVFGGVSAAQISAQKELTSWIEKNIKDDAVILSDFYLQPAILQYGKRTIVLHPKFESKDMREKVREYMEALFQPKEKDFHDFCLKYEADYYVFNPGIFAGPKEAKEAWIYTPRYMVNKKDGDFRDYEVGKMFYQPANLRYFKFVSEVGMKGEPLHFSYRIFKVVTKKDMEEAGKFYEDGSIYLSKYLANRNSSEAKKYLESAEKQLLKAIKLFPGLKDAYSPLTTVYTIKGEEDKAKIMMERWKELVREEQQ